MIWICEYCGAQIESRRKLYAHKKETHNVKNGQAPKFDLTCKYCGITQYVNRATMTRHESHCDKNPDKQQYNTYTMSEEGRKHISDGMKLAHKEGRASSWIGRRKRSYAEQSWFNIFTQANLKFDNNYYVQPYWLDFAWPEKKLYFEVDGQTHFTDKGVEHDNKRTEFLKESGWTLIGRCNWSEYQTLTIDEKKEYVQRILDKLT